MADHETCPKMEMPKMEILMDYISKSHDLLGGGISKKGILMADVSKSCDFPKERNTVG
jgi:hypothetical protein